MRSGTRWRVLLALLATIALVGAGCGNDDDESDAATTVDGEEHDGDGAAAELTTLNVTAAEEAGDGGTTYSFSVPGSVTAGATRLNLENTGVEPHHVQLFRVNSDASIEDVQGQLAKGDPAALLQVGAFEGGTGTVAPGGASSDADAIAELSEGQYVFMCFIENAEGIPHVAQGMFAPFEVGPAEEEAPAVPHADATIEGPDFAFGVPDSLSAGSNVEFVNRSDAQPHEVNVIRLAEGGSIDDVTAFFSGESGGGEGPPPFAPVGGVQAILPGRSQTMALDVDPGEYVLICAIPDPTDGVPHFKKGMVQHVTVS